MNYEEEINKLKQRVLELEKLLLSGKKEEQQSKEKDKTKYMYCGKIFPKNRLVLAVVKDYVAANNPTLSALTEAFDKSLQGSRAVVETFENATNVSDGDKRYFMKEEDRLHLADGTVAVVSTQWGIFNIKKFIMKANILGFEILEV